MANRRAGRQVGDISLHSAEKKAIQHQAFSKIVNQLSELDNEDKARMAALYLFGYGFAMDESEKYKRIWKASRESSDAQRKRNDLVRKRYIHTKEQNLLLIDFANKTYAARRKGTDALQAENRSMKAEVFLWLDA